MNIGNGLNVIRKCQNCKKRNVLYLGTVYRNDDDGNKMTFFGLSEIPLINNICPHCKKKMEGDSTEKLLFKNCKYKLSIKSHRETEKTIIDEANKFKFFDINLIYTCFRIYICPFDSLKITEIIRKKYGEGTIINENLVYDLAIKKDLENLNLLLQYNHIKKVLYKNEYITDFEKPNELAQNLIDYYSSVKPGLNVHGHCKNCKGNFIKPFGFDSHKHMDLDDLDDENYPKNCFEEVLMVINTNCPICNNNWFDCKYYSLYNCKTKIRVRGINPDVKWKNEPSISHMIFYINSTENYLFNPYKHYKLAASLTFELYKQDKKTDDINDKYFNEDFNIKIAKLREDLDKIEYENSIISPGLSIKGKCMNSKCKHFNKYVWSNLGFDYGKDGFGDKRFSFEIGEMISRLKCSECHKNFKNEKFDLLFYDCYYDLIGDLKNKHYKNKDSTGIDGKCNNKEIHILTPKNFSSLNLKISKIKE